MIGGSGVTATDVLVIGGGIAGASLAFELAGSGSVILLEREAHCGYHATGRSAASFTENYGNTLIRRLAIASRSFLSSPPGGFSHAPLMAPRGMITIARTDQLDRLAAELERARAMVASIAAMDAAEAVARVPVLRHDYVAGAIFEPASMELDVHALHSGFLRGARAKGAKVRTDTDVLSLARHGSQWIAGTTAGLFQANVVVNAAGAWADEIAAKAQVAPLGLVPKRRTAFTIPLPEGVDARGWPLVNDVDEAFYFKRDAGQLFVSPADATPSPPMDAYAEDLDVAIGAERLERATTIAVTRVSRSWAGLRTFAPDGSPVVGEDGQAAGFFWLAGQGGYGIKTAPALAAIAAALIRGKPLPDHIAALGIREADMSPARLRTGASSDSSTQEKAHEHQSH